MLQLPQVEYKQAAPEGTPKKDMTLKVQSEWNLPADAHFFAAGDLDSYGVAAFGPAPLISFKVGVSGLARLPNCQISLVRLTSIWLEFEAGGLQILWSTVVI